MAWNFAFVVGVQCDLGFLDFWFIIHFVVVSYWEEIYLCSSVNFEVDFYIVYLHGRHPFAL